MGFAGSFSIRYQDTSIKMIYNLVFALAARLLHFSSRYFVLIGVRDLRFASIVNSKKSKQKMPPLYRKTKDSFHCAK